MKVKHKRTALNAKNSCYLLPQKAKNRFFFFNKKKNPNIVRYHAYLFLWDHAIYLSLS